MSSRTSSNPTNGSPSPPSGGDKDAGKKRDEIASHLDPQQLDSAKQAVEAFVPEHQPDEAIAVKAPAGGWDQAVAAAPAKKAAR